RFLAGEELVTFYKSTPGTRRGFRKVCGAPVLVKFDEHSRSAQTHPGAVALYGVALATLDDDPGVRPDAHAFIIDKAPWFAILTTCRYTRRVPPARTRPTIPDRTIPSLARSPASRSVIGSNAVRTSPLTLRLKSRYRSSKRILTRAHGSGRDAPKTVTSRL